MLFTSFTKRIGIRSADPHIGIYDDRSIINRKAPTTYLGGILTQKRAKTAAQQQRGRQAGRQAGSSTAKRQN